MATATLSAVFKGVDQISAVFEKMAASGAQAVDQWESAGKTASSAFEEAASGAGSAAKAMEDASSSTDELSRAVSDLDSSAAGSANAMGGLAGAVNESTQEFGGLGDEAEQAGSSTEDSIKAISGALAAAGIAKLVNNITTAVIDMANEFSRAEATIIKGSGAMGAELADLNSAMLGAFSSARTGDMAAVAGATADVNTRMRLQGEELERVTSLFLDYSDVTGSNVSGSIRTVSLLMTRLNIDTADTAGVLDRMTFASQASGISVDTLGQKMLDYQSVLQQLNFGLDGSIALFAGLESAGINSGNAIYGLRRSVAYAAQEGRDAGEFFEELVDKIGNMESEADATALALEVFGARAGTEMAAAIRTGAFEIDQWVEKVANADGTLTATADAATTLEEKWQRASNSLNTAFSSVVSPAVDGVSGAFAGMVEGIGNFLQENPALTTALSIVGGILVGVATAVGALLAVFAIKAAILPLLTAKTAIFGVTLSAALWPITLIVAGIAALVAIGAVLFNWLGSINEEYNSLTATSKQHYDAVRDLERQYQRATEAYGENSEAARELRGELEAAQLVFEANRMTREEFIATNDRLVESQQELSASFRESIEEIDREMRSSEALIGRLGNLATQTNLTAAEQAQMSLLVNELNTRFPEMNLVIDETTGALNKSAEAMRELALAQAEQDRIAAQSTAYIEAIAQQIDLEEQLARAVDQTTAATQRVIDTRRSGSGRSLRRARNELQEFEEEQERIQTALDEVNSIIAETEEAWEEAGRAAEEAAMVPINFKDAVNQAVQSVSEELNDLIEAYDEAYAAARSSLDGTFKLFEKVGEQAGLSSQEVIDAWQSQIDFFNGYNENLQKLQDFDLDPQFLKRLSDGSQESAAQAATLMEELNKLSPEAAATRISEINDVFGELSGAKDATAGTMAEIQTEFDTRLNGIQNSMNSAIDDMDMSAGAAQAAKVTMRAYIDQIGSMTSEVHSAAAGAAQAAHRALGGLGISLDGIPGYASGALPDGSHAEGLPFVPFDGYIAELHRGERVLTAEENRAINLTPQAPLINLAAAEIDVPVPSPNRPLSIRGDVSEIPEVSGGGNGEFRVSEDKRITLDINGSGEFHVSGEIDEDAIWEVMSVSLKPMLMGMLQKDIFEEGERAHVF